MAPYAANATDGLVNYEEVAGALGLTSKGLDFHIRAKPTLRSLDSIQENPELRESNLKITYIANVNGTTAGSESIDEGLIVDNFQCAAADHGGPSWTFSANITNNGTATTQFLTVWDIDGGSSLTRQDASRIVAPGDVETVAVDVENLDGFTCDSATTVALDIVDPIQLLRSETLAAPLVTTAATASIAFYLQSSAMYYAPSDDIELSYFGGIAKDEQINLEVRRGTDPEGTLIHSASELVANEPKDRVLAISAGIIPEGTATAYLTHQDSGVIATQTISVNSTAPTGFTPTTASGETGYEEDPAVAIEVGYLNDLVKQFCPTYYQDKSSSPVDETWDSRCDFKNDLDSTYS
jgi:hypothetical protein